MNIGGLITNFKKLDKDNNGFLDKSELNAAGSNINIASYMFNSIEQGEDAWHGVSLADLSSGAAGKNLKEEYDKTHKKPLQEKLPKNPQPNSTEEIKKEQNIPLVTPKNEV